MKEMFSAFAALASLAISAGAATLECPAEKLLVNSAQDSITCDGWQTVTTEQGVAIPVREFYVALSQSESLGDIKYSSIDSTMFLDRTLPQSPLLTEAEHDYDVASRRAASFNGSEPVSLQGEVSRNGNRYAHVMVFPATLNGDSIIAHPTISLSISSREVAASELIPAENFVETRVQQQSSVDSGSPKYVIITSRHLISALQPLERYRSETGYSVEIKPIEDILTTYTGRDQAEQLRNYLKDFYYSGGKYVLLAGDGSIVPLRYAYDYSNRSDTAIPLENLQICDLYFADLTGDWNRDNDSTWGERLDDNPDFIAELAVGRLPFNQPEEFAAYTANLITYETSPGGSDPSYLGRAFFYSSDQMRDLNDGQHNRIAEAFPPGWNIDTVAGVEATRGDDPSPSNLSPEELGPVFREGYGVINIVAHGRVDGFVLKSANYNEWPKTFMLADSSASGQGSMSDLVAAGKPSLYVSLACDNATIDAAQWPSGTTQKSLCQELLSLPNGAVGFVGYTRWGWVGSSYLLQQAFFDSLFSRPDRSACQALNTVKVAFSYYRDMIYGLNYFGDPALQIYASTPKSINFTAESFGGQTVIQATAEGQPVSGCQVALSLAGELIATAMTDQAGTAEFWLPADSGANYSVCLVKPGYITARGYLAGSITTDVDHDHAELPKCYALAQNYPNPFNPGTSIGFDLPTRANVTLSIYNLLGQEIRTLVCAETIAGHHEVMWDGLDSSGKPVASGLYFYRLTAAGFVQTKKMILLR